jgi:uncharacterized membrane protein
MIPIVVTLVIVAGALIRHFYNERHASHDASPWWCWPAAAAALAGAFVVGMTTSPGWRDRLGLQPLQAETPALVAGMTAPPAPVVEIVTSRCSMCHAAEPVWDGIGIAPKHVRLDTPEGIAREAEAIRVQAVMTHAMPPNNITEITPEERGVLAQWIGAGKS